MPLAAAAGTPMPGAQLSPHLHAIYMSIKTQRTNEDKDLGGEVSANNQVSLSFMQETAETTNGSHAD